ncbi:FecR family protein [Muribaculum intestinale]|uniref:FecR family protein n=1 Tax=Muribaculum intestinale TaxID=1796646 RepID=UPI00242B35B6|nr:FecR domain-containing protein [Muribaculum intestinale]
MEDKDDIQTLVEKYLDNRATLSERTRIDSWIEENEELNHWLAARIENSDSTIEPQLRERLNAGIYSLYDADHTNDIESNSLMEDSHSDKRHNIWPLAVAASIIIIAAITGILLLRNDAPRYSIPLTVSTNAGERSHIILPDGSSLTLNNKTEVKYHYDDTLKERSLTLSGEAAFDIATDPEHPFVVTCDGLRIECRGTSFNVKGYPDEDNITVVLSDGVITASTPNQSIKMKPGNKVSYDKHTRNLQSTMVYADDYTEWISGCSRFNDDRLDDILRSVSRYYGVTINIITPSLRDVRLSGSLGRKSLEETLGIIATAADAKYILESDSTICFYRQP